jgi:hypothetical protein
MKLPRITLDMLLISISLVWLVSCCSTITPYREKLIPEHKGVDPAFTLYLQEYMYYASTQALKFDNTVTIGFTNLDDSKGGYRVIGLTSYGNNWREIDIDREYWYNHTNTSDMILLWHELSHSYCTRGHDYNWGKEYGEAGHIKKEAQIDGFYSDGCPISIMYPVIISDQCTSRHYSEYIKEMFQNCDPW